MTILAFQVVRDRSIDAVQAKVNALLPDWQPYGDLVVDHDNRLFCQAMSQSGGAVVTDGMTLADVEPTGSYTDTVTFTVEDGKITEIALS
ncbi:MAG: hypothetical protein RBT81_13115 [Gammaproteobacteria bacterium]|jgi:hypothetical protein|nr:hypothetical protein [Gammaproteobacteria bacterium]